MLVVGVVFGGYLLVYVGLFGSFVLLCVGVLLIVIGYGVVLVMLV